MTRVVFPSRVSRDAVTALNIPVLLVISSAVTSGSTGTSSMVRVPAASLTVNCRWYQASLLTEWKLSTKGASSSVSTDSGFPGVSSFITCSANTFPSPRVITSVSAPTSYTPTQARSKEVLPMVSSRSVLYPLELGPPTVCRAAEATRNMLTLFVTASSAVFS